MDPKELLRLNRDAILSAAARWGAQNVRLFGSVARGDAGPDSDIDLLVDFEPGRGLFDLGGLLSELEALLGRPVDVVTERSLSRYFRREVLSEAVTL